MKPFSSGFVLLVLVAAVSYMPVGSCGADDKDPTNDAQAEFASARERLMARVKAHWTDQIQGSTEIQDERSVDLTAPDGSPTVHGGYKVTSPHNPLVRSDCRAESLVDAVANWGRANDVTIDQAFQDRDRHLHDLQEQFQTPPSFSDWIAHVSECKEFCLFAVRDLLECHVQAVSSMPHQIVLFDTDSDRVDAASARAIEQFAARQASAPEDHFLLVGRASRLGRAGPAYNRGLSERRARSVLDRLVDADISPSAITTLAIGYEEPHLTQEVAALYGVDDLIQRLGEETLNQSVVVVAYSPRRHAE